MTEPPPATIRLVRVPEADRPAIYDILSRHPEPTDDTIFELDERFPELRGFGLKWTEDTANGEIHVVFVAPSPP